ncbi:hypothetical protein HDV00_007130 [Rhizophlyctis rosea]|nr:hypothetical protein HDV00_007130 [Rhizophlyctis rosea]
MLWRITLQIIGKPGITSDEHHSAGAQNSENAELASTVEYRFEEQKVMMKLPRASVVAVSAVGDVIVYGGISSTLYVWNIVEKRLTHEILIPAFGDGGWMQVKFLEAEQY